MKLFESPRSLLNYFQKNDAIRWAVLTGIILLFVVWLVGGYFHAQRRIRNGKRPLAYHVVCRIMARWMDSAHVMSNSSYFLGGKDSSITPLTMVIKGLMDMVKVTRCKDILCLLQVRTSFPGVLLDG